MIVIGPEVVLGERSRGAACSKGLVIVRWQRGAKGLKYCCRTIGAVGGTGVAINGEAVVGPVVGPSWSGRRWLNNGGAVEGGREVCVSISVVDIRA